MHNRDFLILKEIYNNTQSVLIEIIRNGVYEHFMTNALVKEYFFENKIKINKDNLINVFLYDKNFSFLSEAWVNGYYNIYFYYKKKIVFSCMIESDFFVKE